MHVRRVLASVVLASSWLLAGFACGQVDSSAIYTPRSPCPVSVFGSSFKRAGSFYGANANGYFLLESGSTGFGPILLYKKKNSSKNEHASIYLPVGVAADCQQITLDLRRMEKKGPYGFDVKESSPLERVRLVANLFYGVPREGEFRKVDLNATISFGDSRDPPAQVNLYRIQRSAYDFGNFKEIYEDGQFGEMVDEMCLLINGAIADHEATKSCVARIRGNLDS